jgi:hypothetical protein
MLRKPFTLLALALAAAAVTAPIAYSSTKPVDPLAVSYLMGKGLSPSEVSSWTTGACSHRVRAASCYAMFRTTSSKTTHTQKVDPLAVGYLMRQGLTPGQIKSWTVGACSQQVRDALCFAMFPTRTATGQVAPANGFRWGDAGVGAGFTLGVLLVGAAGVAVFSSRRNGGRRAPRTA